MTFWPKPPPTSGEITLTLSSSISKIDAKPPRTVNGACVPSHTVNSPETLSYRAATERVSIDAAVERSTSTRILVT